MRTRRPRLRSALVAYLFKKRGLQTNRRGGVGGGKRPRTVVALRCHFFFAILAVPRLLGARLRFRYLVPVACFVSDSFNETPHATLVTSIPSLVAQPAHCVAVYRSARSDRVCHRHGQRPRIGHAGLSGAEPLAADTRQWRAAHLGRCLAAGGHHSFVDQRGYVHGHTLAHRVAGQPRCAVPG